MPSSCLMEITGLMRNNFVKSVFSTSEYDVEETSGGAINQIGLKREDAVGNKFPRAITC